MDNETVKFKIAVASSDGIVVNQHFGRADKFRIYYVNEDNSIDFKEERIVEPVCQAGEHDDMKLKKNISYLTDCRYVLVSRIGQGAINALEQAGIYPMELPGFIEESIRRLVIYDEVQTLLA